MELPLQLTFTKPQNTLMNEAFSFFYEALQLPAPKVICVQNPVVFYQHFEAWETVKLNSAHSATLDLGPSLNYRVWTHINEKVAKHLSEAAVASEAILPFMKKAQSRQLVIHQALQRHVKKNHPGLKTGLEAHHPHYFDQQWANFHYQSVHTNEGYQHLLHLLQGGLMLAQCYQNAVIWCPLPSHLHLDELGQLHHEGRPALAWEGLKIYHWHGVEVPEDLILNPEGITRHEVMQERNAEVRRCYQEILGAERFAALFELQLVDAETDRQGNRQALYRTAHFDELAKDHLQFAKVICPTTHRNYFLCVPPDIKTIKEAVAWTFGKSPEDYHPDSEV